MPFDASLVQSTPSLACSLHTIPHQPFDDPNNARASWAAELMFGLSGCYMVLEHGSVMQRGLVCNGMNDGIMGHWKETEWSGPCI